MIKVNYKSFSNYTLLVIVALGVLFSTHIIIDRCVSSDNEVICAVIVFVLFLLAIAITFFLKAILFYIRNYQLLKENSSIIYVQRSIPVSISFDEFENKLKSFIMKHSKNDNTLVRYKPMVMDVTPRSEEFDIIFQKDQVNIKPTYEKRVDEYRLEIYSDITEKFSLEILKSKSIDGLIIHRNGRIELIQKLRVRSFDNCKDTSIIYRLFYRIKKCSGLILFGDFLSVFRLISQISR